ncbi:hypothetical protein FGG08_007517 [Glutinoglossum americanum]|uniref:Uncharacterized protein n=1 Tax=Glutinoglossum americanum TaxID=1670608 RepID=A0A9P8I547_9PEZI|nr:hypothetical protein FGG08_007517 [Glutinoglossum americanum]
MPPNNTPYLSLSTDTLQPSSSNNSHTRYPQRPSPPSPNERRPTRQLPPPLLSPSQQHPSPPPPSSAALSRVLQLFRLHKEGRLDSPWTKEPLQPSEFVQLQGQLQRDESLSSHKLRYDYDPVQREITVRMPTLLHESLLMRVAEMISSRLQATDDSTPKSLKNIIREIWNQGHGRMHMEMEEMEGETLLASQYSPDAAFHHYRVRYPRVVLEVSYSQKSRDLEYLADAYIVDSEGNIGLVIGLDLDYGGGKEARVMVWKPEFVEVGDGEQVVDLRSKQTMAESFRNNRGESLSGMLSLQVRDFILPEQLVGIDDIGDEHLSRPIEISFSELTECLNEAEMLHQLVERGEGLVHSRKVRRNRREQTPPRPLSAEREREFREKEEEIRERLESLDGDWSKGNGGRGRRRCDQADEPPSRPRRETAHYDANYTGYY